MSEQETKHYYRIPPCPAYDIEGMESWLGDMAAKGMFLSYDGFFLGTASFEKGHPEKAVYRLQAAKNSTSMWADNNGDPDDEEIELSAELGWKYVAKRGQFYIYKAEDAHVRELNTEPQVQALAIEELRKRERSSIISCFIWLVLYPALYFKTAIITTMLVWGPLTFLLAILFVLLLYCESFFSHRHYKKLRIRLANGENLDHKKSWETGKYRYLIPKAIKFVSVTLAVIFLLASWSRDITEEDDIPLKSYEGSIPFATIADFEPEGTYKLQYYGFGNTVKVRSHILAPAIIDYNELATVVLPDGRYLDGGYYVDYFETRYEWMAKAVALEYLRIDKLERNFDKELELQNVGCDFAIMYTGDLHFHTLIVQNKNKVIQARFYETSETYNMDWQQWAQTIADSLK